MYIEVSRIRGHRVIAAYPRARREPSSMAAADLPAILRQGQIAGKDFLLGQTGKTTNNNATCTLVD